MPDFKSIHTKVNDLKAKVTANSITPTYLGSLLDDFIALLEQINRDTVLIAESAQKNADSAKTAVDTIVDGNASEAIESFKEIIAFLEGFKDSDTLAANLNYIRERIAVLQNKDKTHSGQIASLQSLADRILDFDGIVKTVADIPAGNTSGIYWVTGLLAFRCSIAPDDPTLQILQDYNENLGYGSYYRLFRYDGSLWHVEQDTDTLVRFIDESDFNRLEYSLTNLTKLVERQRPWRDDLKIYPLAGTVFNAAASLDSMIPGALYFDVNDHTVARIDPDTADLTWPEGPNNIMHGIPAGNTSAIFRLDGDLCRITASGLAFYADETKVNDVGEKINSVKLALDTLVSGDASAAIDTFNDIVSFLEGFKDSDTLAANLNYIKERLTVLQNKDKTHSGQIASLQSLADRILDFDGIVKTVADIPAGNTSGIYWVTDLLAFRCSIAPDDPTLQILQDYNENLGYGSYYRLFRYDGSLWHIEHDTDTLVQFIDEYTLSYVARDAEYAKKAVFIDLWNAAGGNYDRDTELFSLNGITNITYDEAIKTYRLHDARMTDSLTSRFASQTVRTLLPIPGCESAPATAMEYTFANCPNLESVVFDNAITPSNADDAFSGCPKLREISGKLIMSFTPSTADMFTGCSSLENVSIHHLRTDLDLSDCPALTSGSFRTLIDNADNPSPITVSVHPSIYAKMHAPEPASDAMRPWKQLYEDAATKNITFAMA